MNINEIYESKYLSAHELQGREVTVVMDRTERVEMNDGKVKICLYFQGKQKGLLLNVTNARTISDLYGPNTNGWLGQPITIGVSWVDFKGTSTEAIRVRPRAPQMNGGAAHQAPPQSQPVQQAAPPPQNAYSQARPDLDDEIPF